MAVERDTLADLCAALEGRVPAAPDWLALVTLANRTLTTPALAGVLAGQDTGSDDVAEFLAAIRTRTRARNAMMLEQLAEACRALDEATIRPILIKGAAFLASSPAAAPPDRLFADLDLLVPLELGEEAIAALGEIGYRRYGSSLSPAEGVNLKRDEDAGGIDLHFEVRPLRPSSSYFDLRRFCRKARVGGAEVLVPCPTAQAAVLIAHDQIQERDYWRGLVDLRHLLDLRQLLAQDAPPDAETLRHFFPSGHRRRALETQLLTLERIFGLPAPPELAPGAMARLQWRRRMAQIARPQLAPTLTALTLLADPPLAPLAGWQPRRERESARTRLRRRMRYYRQMFAAPKPTKV